MAASCWTSCATAPRWWRSCAGTPGPGWPPRTAASGRCRTPTGVGSPSSWRRSSTATATCGWHAAAPAASTTAWRGSRTCVPVTKPASPTASGEAGRGPMEVQIGPAVLTVHADDEVLVCDPDGRLSSTKEQGFFAADTRFVSGYRLRLGRTQPVLLNSAVIQPWSARFEFTNAAVPALAGAIPPQTLHLRLDRTVGNGVHEDYDLTNHSARAVDLEVEVSFECDFADLFDVKRGELVRRGSLQSEWDERKGRLTTRYRHDDFERGFRIDVVDAGSDPEFANGGILFRLA